MTYLANSHHPPKIQKSTYMNIIAKINAHTQNVLSGIILFSRRECPRCGMYCDRFAYYDRYKRVFLVIAGNSTEKVEGFLARCVCPVCAKTFTDYPDFALPFKRYIREQMQDKSKQYLEEDNSSLEEIAGRTVAGRGSCNTSDEQYLAASTLWRWTDYFGNLTSVLARAGSLIRSKDPSSNIFRVSCSVSTRKYTEPGRGRILRTCLCLLKTESEYLRIFKHSFFPYFAITNP